MARENYDVEVPEGTHLGFSRDTDGAHRAHLFDNETNELVGHAELFEPATGGASTESVPDPVFIYVNNDESVAQEDEAEWAEVFASLALLGIILATQRAAPRVKEWWNDRALPSLRDKRASLPSRRKAKRESLVSQTSAADQPAPEAAGDVLAALDDYRASMSSAEARERFIAALVARLFSERQLMLLQDARIEDESGSFELANAMEALTPQQMEEGLRAMLEANPSWPDDETVAELRELLTGGIGAPEPVTIPAASGRRDTGSRRLGKE